MKKVLAAIVASLMLLRVDAVCPRMWHPRGASCYFVSTTQSASWPDAEEFCRILGGYLVDIDDAVEDHYVRGLATLTGSRIVWIGATDIAQEGVWRSAHTQQRLSYIGTWGTGQPDEGAGANCLGLWGSSKYQWADHICSQPWNFICEKKAK